MDNQARHARIRLGFKVCATCISISHMQALLWLPLTLVLSNHVVAQPPSASGVYISAGTIDETLKRSIANNVVDQPIDAVDVASPSAHRASVALLHRTKAETSALIHNRVTEIYQIVEGAGTLVVGGTLEDPAATDLTRVNAGPSQSGIHRGG